MTVQVFVLGVLLRSTKKSSLIGRDPYAAMADAGRMLFAGTHLANTTP